MPARFRQSNIESVHSEEVSEGIESILFVDDDVSIVKMQQQMMKRMGYTVTALDDSLAALSLHAGAGRQEAARRKAERAMIIFKRLDAQLDLKPAQELHESFKS